MNSNKITGYYHLHAPDAMTKALLLEEAKHEGFSENDLNQFRLALYDNGEIDRTQIISQDDLYIPQTAHNSNLANDLKGVDVVHLDNTIVQIKNGDTLAKISQKYGTSAQTLLALNKHHSHAIGDASGNLIFAGAFLAVSQEFDPTKTQPLPTLDAGNSTVLNRNEKKSNSEKPLLLSPTNISQTVNNQSSNPQSNSSAGLETSIFSVGGAKLNLFRAGEKILSSGLKIPENIREFKALGGLFSIYEKSGGLNGIRHGISLFGFSFEKTVGASQFKAGFKLALTDRALGWEVSWSGLLKDVRSLYKFETYNALGRVDPTKIYRTSHEISTTLWRQARALFIELSPTYGTSKACDMIAARLNIHFSPEIMKRFLNPIHFKDLFKGGGLVVAALGIDKVVREEAPEFMASSLSYTLVTGLMEVYQIGRNFSKVGIAKQFTLGLLRYFGLNLALATATHEITGNKPSEWDNIGIDVATNVLLKYRAQVGTALKPILTSTAAEVGSVAAVAGFSLALAGEAALNQGSFNEQRGEEVGGWMTSLATENRVLDAVQDFGADAAKKMVENQEYNPLRHESRGALLNWFYGDKIDQLFIGLRGLLSPSTVETPVPKATALQV